MKRATVSEVVAHLEALGFPFEAADECPWLETLETSFGHALPEPYRSLVRCFRFVQFEVPGFESFSNLGDGSDHDIAVAPFKDRGLSAWLIPRGFLQIGRPGTGTYDPICFDLSQNAKHPQIVRFDHEDILLMRRKINRVVVANSFAQLVGVNAA